LWAVRGVAYVPQPDGASLAGRQYFGRGTEAGVAPASADAIYWYVSVPDAAVGSERDPLAIAHRCARACDDRMRAIVSATRPEDARLDELRARHPTERSGRGPVRLRADAAHPMPPHTGQGAAQALEDAVALACALGPHKGAPHTRATAIDGSLRRYEAVRSAR